MIIVDRALQERERSGSPIRVGMVGAGFMARGIAYQIIRHTPGMRLAAIANRTVANAAYAFTQAGRHDVRTVDSLSQLHDAIAHDVPAVTADSSLLCRAEPIDAIIEVTGDVEHGARVALQAFEHKKHLILMNAELDATLGPILKTRADQAGVVLTDADGDQPGVIMNLYRFVRSIGYRPVLAGNIKGLQDPYRTPETQKAFAEKHGQKPAMVTSFADGTKISMEMAVVANATGLRCGKRGMYGPRAAHVNDAPRLFPADQLLGDGLVDYLLGAEPGPGVFVIGHGDDPIQQPYLRYYKMGDGPFYVFYTPYHLCHLEVPITVARAVLFGDPAVTPLGGPVCEVITAAKRDLRPGETLDGIGGFTCYGLLENADPARRENLLPMGLALGCRLNRGIARDQVLTYGDVELPPGRLADQLRREQDALWAAPMTTEPRCRRSERSG